jgi:hypothetical protein
MIRIYVECVASEDLPAVTVVVQHGRAWEMATAANERHSSGKFCAFAIPEVNGRIGPHDPLSVSGMNIDSTTECVCPIHHAGVKVRVRNSYSVQATDRLDQFRQSNVQQRNAVPEHVSVGSANQQRSLSDANLRVNPDADDPNALCVDRIAVPTLQPGVSRPLLTLRIYKLPFIGTNLATLRREVALGILRATLCAEVTRHGSIQIQIFTS